ncbi:tetratricopeptide repeat protein [Candidatus Curtissbacteria bacterium]|nr:tetratricopeptide repeat protein [Candidatus Curtissbacteria bacterium]
MLKLLPRPAVYFILAVIVVLFYGNTLANGFSHDDLWQIVENKQIRSLDFAKIFGGCIAQELLGGCEDRGFYWRPMQTFFNALVFQLSPSATFFHLMNLVYFWAGGVLVYGLLGKLEKLGKLGAFLGAVIFVTHPVNSEAVNWVSATPELLMTIFFLLSFLFYLKYLKPLKLLKYLILSSLFFFLALLTKETAVFLAALFPLTLMLINANVKRIYANVRMLLIYLVPLVIYLAARLAVLGRVVYEYEGYYALSLSEQILTALALLPRYLWALVYPLPLSFQPQMVPVRDIGDIWVIGGIGVIVLAGILGWFLWTGGQRLILFGLTWVFLGFFPALIFVNKLGETIFAERYLLLSTVGLAIVAVEVIPRILTNIVMTRIRTNRQSPAVLVESSSTAGLKQLIRTNRFVLSIVIVGFLGWVGWAWWAVYQRASDWKDNLSSYQAMIRLDPKHTKAHFQLGEIYRSSGNIELARSQYQQVLKIDPSHEEAKQSLATVAQEYKDNNLSFYYPSDWQLGTTTDKSIHLKDKEGKFKVEMAVAEAKTSTEEYLKSQKESLGELVNEGPALIPGVKEAYVRIWKDRESKGSEGSEGEQIVKLQFFLFGEGKVIKILVSDANSPSMRVFEGVLASIKID